MDKLESKKIAIIGVGHMGSALIKGLIRSGFDKKHIHISSQARGNREAALKADWIIICVKPAIVRSVIADIHDIVENKLVLSVAAGISVSMIHIYAKNKTLNVVRLMPNIPVAVNEGVIGMYASNGISRNLKNDIVSFFSRLGLVVICKREKDIDSLTILSGCGPALVSYLLGTLVTSTEHFRFSRGTAEKVVLQTVRGTLGYIKEKNISFADLQRAVATKGGITEEIIMSLNDYGIDEKIIASVMKGSKKLQLVAKAPEV